MAALTLWEKQTIFAECLGRLLVFIHSYPQARVTLGEGFVASRTGHMSNSLHYDKLAQDLNLFLDREWIKSDHPAWHTIGDFWKSLHPLCRWGGDFKSRDYNHFSITHGGRK